MFFEEPNEAMTKENVNRLLNQFHRIKRLAGSYSPKVTTTYSLLPRSFTGETSDSTGDNIVRRERAQKELKEILDAFNTLTADSRTRLYYKYICEEKKYDYEIYNSQNISKDTYYRELAAAQIEFAEAYRSGELMAYNYKRIKSD